MTETLPSKASDLMWFCKIVCRCILFVPLSVIFTAGVFMVASSKLAIDWVKTIGEVSE